MSKPTIASLTRDLGYADLATEKAREEAADWKKSFENMSDGYSEMVRKHTDVKELAKSAVAQLNSSQLLLAESERRRKKAEQAAARYADALAKAVGVLDWTIQNDRDPEGDE